MNTGANASDGSSSEPFDASEAVESPVDLVEHLVEDESSCLADNSADNSDNNSAIVDESGIAGDFDSENLQNKLENIKTQCAKEEIPTRAFS